MGYLSAGINVADMIDDTWHIQNNDSFSTAQKVLLHTGNIAVGVGSIALCLFGTTALFDASKWILWNVLVVSNPTAIAIGSIILLLLATYQLSKWENNLDNIIYNDENTGANLRQSVNPSGIVYEVNHDNINDKTKVLENVPVTLFYKNNIKDNEYDKWNASEYEQLNPLYTN